MWKASLAPTLVGPLVNEKPKNANVRWREAQKMSAKYKGGKVFSFVWWRVVDTSGARQVVQMWGLIPGHIMPHEWSTMLL